MRKGIVGGPETTTLKIKMTIKKLSPQSGPTSCTIVKGVGNGDKKDKSTKALSDFDRPRLWSMIYDVI